MMSIRVHAADAWAAGRNLDHPGQIIIERRRVLIDQLRAGKVDLAPGQSGQGRGQAGIQADRKGHPVVG